MSWTVDWTFLWGNLDCLYTVVCGARGPLEYKPNDFSGVFTIHIMGTGLSGASGGCLKFDVLLVCRGFLEDGLSLKFDVLTFPDENMVDQRQ